MPTLLCSYRIDTVFYLRAVNHDGHTRAEQTLLLLYRKDNSDFTANDMIQFRSREIAYRRGLKETLVPTTTKLLVCV